MATVKYKVKKGDTLASLGNPQAIMAMNSGVPKLSTGQVINLPQTSRYNPIPKPPKTNGSFMSGGGQVNTAQIVPPLTNGSFMSGGGQVNTAQIPINRNIPSNVTNSGYISQNGAFTSTQAQSQLVGGSFYSGSGEINLTGVTTGGNSAGSSSNAAARPTGVYTGGNSATDIAWKNYWNYSAANPQTVENPVSTYMPTRNDIWEQKAAQRRRNGGKGGSEQTNGYNPVQPIGPLSGNNVTAGSWRVG